MESKKNRTGMVKVGQVKKSPILALGTLPTDVRGYEKAVAAYGNVTPIIVSETGGTYQILSGQARYTACTQKGCHEVPAIITRINDEAEQMKLSLLLSTIREMGGALSEAELIHMLTTRYGITNRELTKLLGKSKAWVSKRLLLATNLHDGVKAMVTDGLICARTAEEIAKLPEDVQTKFAGSIARDELNKTEVTQLVKLYRGENASAQCREAIINAPLTVLPTLQSLSNSGRKSNRKDKRSDSERLAGTARYLIRLHEELKTLIATANSTVLMVASSHFKNLRESMAQLDILLAGIIVSADPVSPGKRMTVGKAVPE
jgi:ParB family chromosome partitioning protein